ncbi:leukotoxin LktA family filamentous adhesin [Falsihalocynthiibacter sp. SS001]|uniref:leukotoxin LktA family filamentous adhesin n=1 Tax=Falsihalocynthiibacter sp. SS001 TaxID=3349698 RepID=UPI0036D41D8E
MKDFISQPVAPMAMMTKRKATRTSVLKASASPFVLAMVVAAGGGTQANAQALNLGGPSANKITPDGRTNTNVTVSGNRTKITTGTVSNGVGFNSFKDFQQASGQRVDLFVPDRAGSLVNVVRNGSVIVNGELNAYKDGKIGGNVFFSSPDGFVLGKSGTINVGSLTVNTPTGAFLDKVVRADGTVNNAVAQQLMRGEIPMSSNGVISIAGKVTAKGGITLQGHTVNINANTGPLTGEDLGQRTKFNATVNQTGLVEGAALVARGGSLAIVAQNEVRVGGRLDASASESGNGGDISVTSRGNITLEGTAELSADGAGARGKGGTVIVKADGDLYAHDFAYLSAIGTGTGNAGFVELSGKNALIGAVNVNLTADEGKAGTLLFDPYNLYIGGSVTDSGTDDDYSAAPSIYSVGANVVLEADNSITIVAGGVIDSTNGADPAGDITLEAPEIILEDGSTITAGTTGNVYLTAARTSGGTASIEIGQGAGVAPILSGANIYLSATSTLDQSSLLLALPKAEAIITLNSANIDASDIFSATATAASNGGVGMLPIGVVVTDVTSAVDVLGTTDLSAGSIALTADATVESNILTESLAPANAKADGAVAVSTINSTSRVKIGGNSNVNATGAIDLLARNAVTSVADATPQTAAFGASVGVSVVDVNTSVELSENATLNADSLTLEASTVTDISVTAKAAEGGSTGNKAGSEADEQLTNYEEEASTADGSVSVVGGLAVSDLTSDTSATISSSIAAGISGAVTVKSSTENTANVIADGSAVDSTTGVGVAVGINLAKVKNDAVIETDITAGSLDLSALTTGDGNSFSTESTSGAGASNVGVAGSVAINLIDTQSVAQVASGATVAASGAVNLTADNQGSSKAEALPVGGGASGDQVGVGASVALNILANRSTAEIADSATVTGAGAMTLAASGTYEAETVAEAGAAGGIAVTPALALSIINNTTTARLGSGATQAASGDVSISAAQSSSTITTASGKAAGSKAAIGASLALALIDDQSLATTERNINATGSVSFSAMGASSSVLTSTASASGGAAAEDDGSASSGEESDVDSTVTKQMGAGSDKQKASGVGDSSQQASTETAANDEEGRSASSGGSKVSVAAAVAINDQNNTVQAVVPNGVEITSGGVLSIETANNTTGEATSTGAAVGVEDEAGNTPDPAQIGIGAAVSVNVVKSKNDAILGVATHDTGGLNIAALKLDVAKSMADSTNTDTKSDSYIASATSGAGGSKVGIAGSVAINLIDTQSVAQVASGATVAASGAVNLTADNQGSSKAEALPVGGGASGDQVGVGASVALNILANRSTAEIADSATVTGAGAMTLAASGTYEAETVAEAGAAGGIAVTPALALSIINNTTTARLGSGATQAASGDVSISAAQSSSTITTASGKAAGSKAAIGASLALALIDDQSLATTERNINATGSVSFSAMGASSSVLTSTASASGGAAAEDDGSASSGEESDVDSTVTKQMGAGSDKQKASGVGDSSQQASTETAANDEEGRSASSGGSKVSVAAAVAINDQNNTVQAVVPNGVEITSGGVLSIETANNTTGEATSTGAAVGVEDEAGNTPDPAQIGIGAAVSVNVVKSKNDAILGVATHDTGGLNIAALKLDVAKSMADSTNTDTKSDSYIASATSGAGGSKVGIAGSVAINLIDTQSVAQVASGATVAASGAVNLTADNQGSSKAEALPVGGGASGDQVGVGASVALNILANRSTAEIADSATVTGAGAMTLAASGTYEAETVAEAGAAGGIAVTPALALSIINNTTTARLGSGATQAASGDVSISAAQSSSTITTASGKAAGSKAAIGASLALALIDDQSLATTERNINATGAVSFSAGGVSSSTLSSTASAAGTKAGSDADAAPTSSGESVDDTTTAQMNDGADKQQASGVGDSSQQSSTSSQAGNSSKRSAKTSEGKVAVAAAVAINDQKSTTQAVVPDSVSIVSGGAISIKSANNTNGSATSDGSAVKAEGGAATQIGVGVAVSVNVVEETNTARLGNATHSGNGVNVAAVQSLDGSDVTDEINAQATSGAGASKVGIAGSLAINTVNADTSATIGESAIVNAGTGTSSIIAEQKMNAVSKALPSSGGATGTQVGVGASVALNFINTDTYAELEDGATFTNGNGFNVSASTDVSTETEASAGSAGGIAVDASVALAMLNQNTVARIGTGNALSMGTGAVTISASNAGTHSAKSDGNTKSGKAGVGASAALILGNGDADGALENTSVTTASLERDLTAGSLAISATSSRTYDAHATATAEGGKFSQSGDQKKNDTTGGSSTSANTMDKTQGSQRDGQGKKNGSKVTVAAAAGIAAAQDKVTASLGDVTVNVGGPVSVDAANTVGLAVSGDGSAVNAKSQISVGVGVGLAILNNKTEASIADGASITSDGVAVSATSKENAQDGYESKLSALGIAGAGGKKVSVAGALAVGISTGDTQALIGDNTTITSTGAVTVDADNTSHLAAKAAAGSVATAGTGIGASIAVAVSEKSYKATVGAGANIAAESLRVHAQNHKISGTTKFDFTDLDDLRSKITSGQLLGDNNYYVEAIGGAAGSKTSVQGSFAVMTFDDEVLATVGESQSGALITGATLNLGTGEALIEAQNDITAKALSGAISLSGGTGAGLASSVLVSSGTVRSALASGTTITSAGGLTNQALASQDIQVFGVSVAAAASNAVNGIATVLTAENTVEALVGNKSSLTINGDATIKAQNDFDNFSLAGGAAGGGSNGVGAAASVVTVNNITRAEIEDADSTANGADIDANGAIEVSASATETGKTVAAAGAAAGSNAVGAGVGVYVLNTTTEALVGRFASLGRSFSAGSTIVSATDTTNLLSISGAASGGGNAGAGAGVTVGVITKSTKAEIDDNADVDSGNIIVNAKSSEDISMITFGVGIGGSAGLAGAVAVDAVNTTTTARVGENANLFANGNVAVMADNATNIDMLDGSLAIGGSAGVGASVGVTVVNTDTNALIDDEADVTALGNLADQDVVIDHKAKFIDYGADEGFAAADVDRSEYEGTAGSEDTLLTSADARTQGLDLLLKKRVLDDTVTLSTVKSMRGVIVNSVGTTSVRSLSAGGAAAGSVAISISASVPVITNNTEASIGENALINKTSGSANALQSVSVAAASDVYTMAFSGAVAGGGAVGGGAGVSVAVVDATTTARIGTGAEVAAARDVLVSAQAKQDLATMAAAGAVGGTAGLAGSATTFDITSNTTAELGGTVVAQNNVDVLADDVTRSAMLAGSVAIGGTAGVGAAVSVILLDKTVTSSIADNADVTALGLVEDHQLYDGSSYSGTTNGRGVNVAANSGQSVFTLAVSGAGGLYAGISGVVALDLMDVTTSAFIGANTKINQTSIGSAGSTQDVVVSARDTTVTSVGAGAVSAGLVGLAGAVDVGIFKNTTAAYIKSGAEINATRNVMVSGLANKAGAAEVASGSGGAIALAAGIAIYNYGDGVAPNGEADKQLGESSDGAADMDGIQSDAQAQAGNSQVDDLLKESDNDHVKAISASAQATRGTIDIASAASTLSVPAGTSASVGDAEINAGGALKVNSSDDLVVDITTGAFAVGGGAIGAGIGVLTVETTSTAKIDGGSRKMTVGSVEVKAKTDHDLEGDSYVGAAAGSIALGADVSVFEDTSSTNAYINNGNLEVTNAVSVMADARRWIDVEGYGVTIAGIAGVGASVATSKIGGAVNAHITGTDITDSGSIAVVALSDDKAKSITVAAGGGVGLSIQGAFTISDVTPTVSALIDSSNLWSTGEIKAEADADAEVETSSYGVSVSGGLAVGASDAESHVGAIVSAKIQNNTTLNAGSIMVSSDLDTAKAKSYALGAAGALVGVSATNAESTNTSSSIASVSGGNLTASGTMSVTANSIGDQDAYATGIAAGIVAAGSNTTLASSNVTTHATLTEVNQLRVGGLTVTADGTTVNTAETIAGSGGVIAGSAAVATTKSTSSTKARIINNSGVTYDLNIPSDAITLEANQTTTFAGSVDSRQASVVGASGANIYHTVNSDVDAWIVGAMNIYGRDLIMTATNKTINNSDGYNVNSISGGLANVPAGGSTVNVTHTTNAGLDDNTYVHLLSPSSGYSLFQLAASNDVTVNQKAKLDSGGAIALAFAEAEGTFNIDATVGVGDNSTVLVDKGDAKMAAWSNADIDLRANATTYGLAGAPSGDAKITYTGNNSAYVGTNSTIQASTGYTPLDGSLPSYAEIDINSGVDLAGNAGKLIFNAIVDLYNKTAIPIPTGPNPTVTAVVNSTVTLAADSELRAAGDITISASRGNIDATAKGTGKDIYREALAKAASAVSNAFGGGDVTFDYHGGSTNTNGGLASVLADGKIQTGIQRHKILTINYVSESCDITTQACIAAPTDADNITYTVSGPEEVGTQILERLRELRALLEKYDDDVIAKAAYKNEIDFLENKLVALGLGEYNASGEFVPGAYAGPSPKDAALAVVDQSISDLSTVKSDFTQAGLVSVTGTLTDAAELIKNYYDGGTYGVVATADSAIASIQNLSTYASADSTYYDAAIAARDAGAAAATAAQTAKNNIIASRDIITQNTALINSATASLEAALLAGRTADATTEQNNIANAKAAIETELGKIETYTATLKTKTALAHSSATDLHTALDNLIASAPEYTNPNTTSDDAATKANAIADQTSKRLADAAIITQLNQAITTNSAGEVTGGGSLTFISESATRLATENTNATTEANNIQSAVNTLQQSTTSAGTIGGSNSLTQYVDLLSTLTTQLVDNRNTAATASSSSGSPTTYVIEVDDTVARLGNISINADQLTGTGLLNAPTDAKIVITNNTSNQLKVGNLIIPQYDAGHLRFNGVLISENADITSLNTTGAAANFANINTQETAGSSRGIVELTSNYNAQSLTYYNPSSPLTQVNTQRVAPDIITKSGTTIENSNGSVKITSASGNIYVNGSINAGSLDIVAKNGDFVSSYVNGFDHIGGDPAAFNSPTRASEKGSGITANGSISISARFLNINSRIQSGIANFTLNIADNQLLTTDKPTEIGLTQAAIDAKVAQYILDLEGASPVSPILSITNSNGRTITINMAPAGVDPTELADAIADYQTRYSDDNTTSPVVTLKVNGVDTSFNIKDLISGDIKGRLEFTVDDADNFGGSNTYAVLDPQPNRANELGAAYDTANKQYVVDGATVSGGYIQLFGQILNTASSGAELNVLDGFGRIDINNASNIPVVLQSLSTGKDDTGTLRGTQGRIEITNVTSVDTSNVQNPDVKVTKTIYTRDYDPSDPANAQIRIAEQKGYINSDGDIILDGALNTSFDGNRTSSYTPEGYARYVWTTGEDFKAVSRYSNIRSQIFGADAFTYDSVEKLTSLGTPQLESLYRLPEGTYITTESTQYGGATARNSVNGAILSVAPTTGTNQSLNDTQYTEAEISYVTKSDLEHTGSSRDCNWWTLCIDSKKTDYYKLTQEYTTIKTKSLKANNTINVNFIGQDQGQITVNSNNGGSVILTGTLDNVAGNTTITATQAGSSIVQGNNDALISATSINLDAGDYVGGVPASVINAQDAGTAFSQAPADAAIIVRLNGANAGDGGVSANARNGNVSLLSRSNLVVDQITASGSPNEGKGNVSLVAYRDMLAKDTDAFVQGARVDLVAISGDIGGTADDQMLMVNTGFTTNPAERPFGDPALDPSIPTNARYGLSATASGDIGIRSAGWNPQNGEASKNEDGSILVDQVLSIGGDVRLKSSGFILDNNPIEVIDTRTYDELLGYWEELGLLAEDAARGVDGTNNAEKRDQAVLAYKQSKEHAYNQYWNLRDQQSDPSVYDPSFQVVVVDGSPQHAALTSYYSDQILAENPTYTTDQVNTAVAAKIDEYEAQQTAEYHALNETVGGLTASYDENFSYVVSTEEASELLDGSIWTERELAFSIAPGALKTVTGTNPISKDPNVSGLVVSLDAGKGIGETKGQLSGDPGIEIRSSLDPRDLTNDQKVALASAERSDLLLTLGVVALPDGFYDRTGNETPEELARLAEQLEAFQAAEALGLTTGAPKIDIQLGDKFEDLSEIQKAALNAAALGLVSADDTLLTALSKRPLNFAAADRLDVSVANVSSVSDRDLGATYLASEGSVKLGTVDTYGETRIKVRGDINNATGADSVSTGNLILEASQGGIGNINPLRLDLVTGATTTARAQNGVNIAFDNDGLIDTIYSPENIKLSANGSLINANGDNLINILGSQVELVAVNGSIGEPTQALNVGVNLGGGIDATAGNGINLYGPSSFRFVIQNATSTGGGTITLTGAEESEIDGTVETAGDIALIAGSRQVLTENAEVHTAAGDITVNAGSLKMLNGSSTTADAGAVDIVTTVGDALVTAITAGSAAANAVSIQAAGRIFAGTLDPRIDIKAMTAGAGVKLVAELGIGDKTQANTKAWDGVGDEAGTANAVTDVPNPLRIMTHNIDAEAKNGDMYLRALSDTTLTSVKSEFGTINVEGDAALTVTSALSGGTQTFVGQDDVTFAQLTTTGLPADAGDVNVTSVNGAVVGGDIDANGNVNLSGNGVTFGALIAGLNAAIDSSLEIVGDTLEVAGTIDATAGTTIDVNSALSGGTQTFVGQGDVTFAQLTTTGLPADAGDVNVTSVNGAVIGGDIDANGNVNLNGNGVTFGALIAGLNAAIDSSLEIVGDTLEVAGTIDATAGTTIDVNSALSGGTQTFVGQDDVTFAQLTTTGLPADAGDVNVTSVNGAVVGGDIDANGNVNLSGNGVTFGALIAGLNAAIDSSLEIVGDTLEVAGTIDATAGTTIDVNNALSGGTQTFVGQDDVTFAQLTTTGLRRDAGDVNVRSVNGAVIGGNIDANGNVNLNGNGVTFGALIAGLNAAIDSSLEIVGDTLEVAGTIDATAGTTIGVNSALSGGTQTFVGQGDVTFAQLTTTGLPADAGDVNVTSVNGAVIGGDIDANGNVNLSGNGVTFGALIAGLNAAIDSSLEIVGDTLEVAGTIDATAGTTVDVNSALSGGTQTFVGQGDVTFAQLTTTGLPADAGDVNVTSVNGAVIGGDIDANGNVNLNGNGVTFGALIAGLNAAIDSSLEIVGDTLEVAGTIDATAGTTIDVNNALSGGTQTFVGQDDVTFAQLTTTGLRRDAGDVNVRSVNGAVIGGDIDANGSHFLQGNGVTFGTIIAGINSKIRSTLDIIGDVQIAGETIDDSAGVGGNKGSIRIGLMKARNMLLEATHKLVLPDVRVAEFIRLRADIIEANITQDPNGPNPLRMTIEGHGGGVATRATLDVDAPAGIIVPSYRVVDSTVDTTATMVDVRDAYIPGTAVLTTPDLKVLVNNRTPAPVEDVNVQIHEQDFAFKFDVDGFEADTTGIVVLYNVAPDSTSENPLAYWGISLIRDTVRLMPNADEAIPVSESDDGEEEDDDLGDGPFVKVGGVNQSVYTSGFGPMVRLR